MGTTMPQLKLDKQDVESIKLICDFTNLLDREIAQMFGVSRGHITKIRNKKRWNYNYGEQTESAARYELKRRIGLF